MSLNFPDEDIVILLNMLCNLGSFFISFFFPCPPSWSSFTNAIVKAVFSQADFSIWWYGQLPLNNPQLFTRRTGRQQPVCNWWLCLLFSLCLPVSLPLPLLSGLHCSYKLCMTTGDSSYCRFSLLGWLIQNDSCWGLYVCVCVCKLLT